MAVATGCHVVVRGKVQGVSFRYSLRQEAEKRAVVGWVRNLGSGEVEALLEGEESALRALLEWIAVGPPGAKVEEVVTTTRAYTGAYSNFSIERTHSGRPAG